MTEQILSHLPQSHPWRDGVLYFPSVVSTNTLAKALAAQGAPAGTVIVAGQQTGGRGRLGRTFYSPEGSGLYLSAILRPNCDAAQLMHLTCSVAVAACDAIGDVTGLIPDIKWINDLLFDRRKVAGILTELSLRPGTSTVDSAIIGIGVNCLQHPTDFPPELQKTAGSLVMKVGRAIEPAAVAAALICRLSVLEDTLLCGKSLAMVRYRHRCLTIGQDVMLHQPNGIFPARAIDVDDDGALLVRYPDGRVATITSGEASVRVTDGYV